MNIITAQHLAAVRLPRAGVRLGKGGWGRSATVLFGVKLLATLFAVFVYGSIVPFVDAERYLSATLSLDAGSLVDRTLFTDNLYALLRLIFVKDIMVHLVTSFLAACAIWYVFRQSYSYASKSLLWLCILLPHFLIWSGVVAKEPIAIIAFVLVIKSCVDFTIYGRTNAVLMILGVSIGLLMRPHFAIAYCLLLAASIVLANLKNVFTGQSGLETWVFVFLVTSGACLTGLWWTYDLWADSFYETMERARDYFLLYDANSNRYDVEWLYASDYFRDLWWGIPVSIVGPTFSETLERSYFIPVFIEGIVAFALVLYFPCRLLILCLRNPYFRPLICGGYLPALILALAANYMLGVFNPGSAIRYKQSLAPLFYFYPLLLLAEAKRKETLFRSNLEQGV